MFIHKSGNNTKIENYIDQSQYYVQLLDCLSFLGPILGGCKEQNVPIIKVTIITPFITII